MHDGITRDYILHLPSDYDESKSYPFVYNLHGFTSNASQQQFYSGMDATADENGFIVCYPNGIATSWNVGWAFGSTADDVGFLIALVEALSVDYSIDSDRLYSCGMSNGGFMSYKLACDASDRFAAIASVTGSMVPSELEECDPIRRMPVMQIHGTDDPTVAYNGSNIGAGIEEVVNFWAAGNNCNLSPEIIPVEDINTSDQSTAERIEYSGCEDDKEVVFYKIDGGGHTWPDAALSIGTTNRDFNASQEIWNFFSRFDLNGAVVSTDPDLQSSSEIVLFPNPVNDVISLSNLPLGTESITIIDAVGKVVIARPYFQERTTNIKVSDIDSGLYFLLLKGTTNRGLVKFVKK